MDENVIKYNRLQLERVKEKLIKNGFEDVRLFENHNDVKEEIIKLIPKGSTVGVGGSVTIRETGILAELEKDRQIITHRPGTDISERKETWKKAAHSDFYLASPQAISLEGKLFFLDKYGNRLSSVIFGPTRVVLIAGYNKIVKDDAEASWRSKNVAAVKNTNRLKSKTPCIKTGECSDCSSDDRICNVYLSLWKRPPATDYTIFLVNEELGY
ncbi:MAG: lactate utilization protein [Elusimicrobiota bacterium]